MNELCPTPTQMHGIVLIRVKYLMIFAMDQEMQRQRRTAFDLNKFGKRFLGIQQIDSPARTGRKHPDDSGPNDVDSMPHLAAIAAKKPTENGGGESL